MSVVDTFFDMLDIKFKNYCTEEFGGNDSYVSKRNESRQESPIIARQLQYVCNGVMLIITFKFDFVCYMRLNNI